MNLNRVWMFLIVLLNFTGVYGSTEVDSIATKTINGKKLIEYKVAEHEGWYGIARKYGVSYNDLRHANEELGDTLHIGQVIHVPMNKSKTDDKENVKSAFQKTKKMKQESRPVIHVIKQKETLFAVAKKFKVTKEQLKKWNHLSSVNLKMGDSLIVGYKKVMVKQESAGTHETTKAHHQEKEVSEHKSMSIARDTVKYAAKAEKDSSGRIIPGDKKPVDTLEMAGKPEFGAGRKEVTEQGVATWIDDENINPNKYFALHRSASVGTIVKVTNRMNKRAVFVKVVGRLPDTGDNENTIIKISKASAEKLGVRDQRFQCDLSYGMSVK